MEPSSLFSVTRPTEMPPTGRISGTPASSSAHGAGANRGHRGGAVGFGDFRGNADGVGEIRFVRDDGLDGALGERAVTDLAAVDATHAAGFTDGEGREVVVKDEALAVFATGVVVEVLLFIGRGQRGNCRGPGFLRGRRWRNRERVAGCRLRRKAGGGHRCCGRRRARLFP